LPEPDDPFDPLEDERLELRSLDPLDPRLEPELALPRELDLPRPEPLSFLLSGPEVSWEYLHSLPLEHVPDFRNSKQTPLPLPFAVLTGAVFGGLLPPSSCWWARRLASCRCRSS